MSAEQFLDRITLAAVQAGTVALRMRPEVRDIGKEGETHEARALTEADLACQDVLLLAIRAAFPEAALDAEEESALAATFPAEGPGRAVAVVDPMDGTLNYLEGSDDFGVMAAWCEGGRYEASIVHFPVHDRTFLARAGEGAWELKGGARVPLRATQAPPLVAVTRAATDEVRGRIAEAGFEVIRTRCSAVDGVAPLLGRATAAVCAGRPGRRRAIGYLITEQAGGTVLVRGEDWNRRDPRILERGGWTVLASDRDTAQRLHRCLEDLA